VEGVEATCPACSSKRSAIRSGDREAFEPVDAALDGVTPPVVDRAELRRSSSRQQRRDGHRGTDTRGTAPLHGCLGSAIWSGLVTPGRNPLPTTLSRTNWSRPAFSKAYTSSLHLVTRSQVARPGPDRPQAPLPGSLTRRAVPTSSGVPVSSMLADQPSSASLAARSAGAGPASRRLPVHSPRRRL
jgi:hypothetical protein